LSQRWFGKGKGPADLPHAGVYDAVPIDPTVNYVDAATGSEPAARAALAFHELAEAYAEVDKCMPYISSPASGTNFELSRRQRCDVGLTLRSSALGLASAPTLEG